MISFSCSQWNGFIVTAVKESVSGWPFHIAVKMDSGGMQSPVVLFSIHEQWRKQHVYLGLLKFAFMSELLYLHGSQEPFTEVMSNSILIVCSILQTMFQHFPCNRVCLEQHLSK